MNVQRLERYRVKDDQECRRIYLYDANESEAFGAAYPLEKEQALVQAIAVGDSNEAKIQLNEIYRHAFFAAGGDFFAMRTRSLEWMVLLSRGAVDGNVDVDLVLELNKQFLKENDSLRTADELAVWLNRVVDQYSMLVFERISIKHKRVMYKAVSYIKDHYREKLTVEDVARHVGFSPTYFSKIFKKELGTTFNNYLLNFRVERSKNLLLVTDLLVNDICAEVGLEDQSYFIKVFRRYTGVTPGKFRKQQGQLNERKENGLVK